LAVFRDLGQRAGRGALTLRKRPARLAMSLMRGGIAMIAGWLCAGVAVMRR
jgi:hypothetical protein